MPAVGTGNCLILSYCLPLAIPTCSDFSNRLRRCSRPDDHPAVAAVLCGALRSEPRGGRSAGFDLCALPVDLRTDTGAAFRPHGAAATAVGQPDGDVSGLSVAGRVQPTMDGV